MAAVILPFDRDSPCPACGIGLEVRNVCRQLHADLVPDPADPTRPVAHLHVVCTGCGWSAYMDAAGRGDPPPPTPERRPSRPPVNGAHLVPRPPERAVLPRRVLNRTLLARQWLLETRAVPVVQAVEHLVGLQAQVPADPYLSLRARLQDLVPSDLEDLLVRRAVVRLGLFRGTLHLVTARDALSIRPLMQAHAVRSFRSSPFARRLGGVDIDDVIGVGAELLEKGPLSLPQLGTALAGRWPSADSEALAYAVRILVPFVQVPPRGLWGRTGAPRITTLASWLDGVGEAPTTREELVLRYLRAFGPATVADVRTWSSLTDLAATVAGMRDRLRTYRDDAGRELLDADDAPFVDADAPAPIRFLGEYDNVFLAHADRSRITGARPWGAAYARKRAFFVDGYLAGAWRAEVTPQSVVMTIEQALPLSGSVREEVAVEASAILSFVAPDRPPDIRFGVL